MFAACLFKNIVQRLFCDDWQDYTLRANRKLANSTKVVLISKSNQKCAKLHSKKLSYGKGLRN